MLFPNSSLSVAAQAFPESHIEVADWSFDVEAAVSAPSFSEGIHLGLTEDGRWWLVVSLTITNTTSESHKIHSDDIQLLINGEKTKQTGDESQHVADELGRMSIGGTTAHSIDAGATVRALQVYKVPDYAKRLVLNFDFNGSWTVDLAPMVQQANGDVAVLGVADVAPGANSAGVNVRGANFEIRVIGAATSQVFSDGIHLGKLEDGRSWLAVSYSITNISDEDHTLESSSIQILSGGDSVKQAGDETRSAAAEIGLEALKQEFNPGQERMILQVFKVDFGEADNTLKVDLDGIYFVDLKPYTSASSGDAAFLLEENAVALVVDPSDSSIPPTVGPTPTPAPSPTPRPSPTPEPTKVPEKGSAEKPGRIGDTLMADGRIIKLVSVEVVNSLGFSTPKGNYVYVVITVQIGNISESGQDHGYNELNFSCKDIDRNWDFDDTLFNYSDQPLGSGELSPGETTWGQVVLEVNSATTNLRIKYDTGGVFGGENMYWLVQLP